jgi:hypothetical protein
MVVPEVKANHFGDSPLAQQVIISLGCSDYYIDCNGQKEEYDMIDPIVISILS